MNCGEPEQTAEGEELELGFLWLCLIYSFMVTLALPKAFLHLAMICVSSVRVKNCFILSLRCFRLPYLEVENGAPNSGNFSSNLYSTDKIIEGIQHTY